MKTYAAGRSAQHHGPDVRRCNCRNTANLEQDLLPVIPAV
jgi:hypothetical protein